MKQNAFTQPSVLISRRTGIDRRWIPSKGHQPERRRGGDRRADRKRTFNQQLVAGDDTHDQDHFGASHVPSKDAPLNRLPSPESDGWGPGQSGAVSAIDAADES